MRSPSRRSSAALADLSVAEIAAVNSRVDAKLAKLRDEIKSFEKKVKKEYKAAEAYLIAKARLAGWLAGYGARSCH